MDNVVRSAKLDTSFGLRYTAAMQKDGLNHLYEWRKHRRMTQAKLADMIGTTPAVISLLERGERPL